MFHKLARKDKKRPKQEAMASISICAELTVFTLDTKHLLWIKSHTLQLWFVGENL